MASWRLEFIEGRERDFSMQLKKYHYSIHVRSQVVTLLYSGASTPVIGNARSCVEPQNRCSGVSMQRSRVQTSDALYPEPRDWAGMRFWLQELREVRALAD